MSVRSEALGVIIKRTSTIMDKDMGELSADTTFKELGFKSGNYVQVTTVLEDEFDIEVPYMDFKRNETFGQAAAYIEELVEG